MDRMLALPRRGEAAERLRRRIARDRGHLFVFITERDVPATNNVSERALRPSVIFRKVTNGFRSEWARKPMPRSAPSSAPPRQMAAQSSTISGPRSQSTQIAGRSRSLGEQLPGRLGS
ncbi:MAG: IS66 family transposase [Janthinobacterium lividum]